MDEAALLLLPGVKHVVMQHIHNSQAPKFTPSRQAHQASSHEFQPITARGAPQLVGSEGERLYRTGLGTNNNMIMRQWCDLMLANGSLPPKVTSPTPALPLVHWRFRS